MTLRFQTPIDVPTLHAADSVDTKKITGYACPVMDIMHDIKESG